MAGLVVAGLTTWQYEGTTAKKKHEHRISYLTGGGLLMEGREARPTGADQLEDQHPSKPPGARLPALPLSAFKLGITTDEIDDGPLVAARFLRRYGLSWAEVRNIWGPYNTDQPVEKVRQARAIFDEQGVRVSVLDAGFFKIPLPPDTPEGRRRVGE